METEIGVVLPEVMEHLLPPKAERGKGRLLPRNFQGSVALSTPLFWTLVFRTVREYICKFF